MSSSTEAFRTWWTTVATPGQREDLYAAAVDGEPVPIVLTNLLRAAGVVLVGGSTEVGRAPGYRYYLTEEMFDLVVVDATSDGGLSA